MRLGLLMLAAGLSVALSAAAQTTVPASAPAAAPFKPIKPERIICRRDLEIGSLVRESDAAAPRANGAGLRKRRSR